MISTLKLNRFLLKNASCVNLANNVNNIILNKLFKRDYVSTRIFQTKLDINLEMEYIRNSRLNKVKFCFLNLFYMNFIKNRTFKGASI